MFRAWISVNDSIIYHWLQFMRTKYVWFHHQTCVRFIIHNHNRILVAKYISSFGGIHKYLIEKKLPEKEWKWIVKNIQFNFDWFEMNIEHLHVSHFSENTNLWPKQFTNILFI